MDEVKKQQIFLALLSEFPVYDDAVWQAVLITDEYVIRRILEIFVGDYIERYVELKKLHDECDYPNMWSQLHTIKGSADNVGARRLGKTAELLEHACRQQDYVSFHDTFPELEREFNEFRVAVGV